MEDLLLVVEVMVIRGFVGEGGWSFFVFFCCLWEEVLVEGILFGIRLLC